VVNGEVVNTKWSTRSGQHEVVNTKWSTAQAARHAGHTVDPTIVSAWFA